MITKENAQLSLQSLDQNTGGLMKGALNWINETVLASINKWNNNYDHLQYLTLF